MGLEPQWRSAARAGVALFGLIRAAGSVLDLRWRAVEHPQCALPRVVTDAALGGNGRHQVGEGDRFRMQGELEMVVLAISERGLTPEPFDQLYLGLYRCRGGPQFAKHRTHQRLRLDRDIARAGTTRKIPLRAQDLDRAE